MRRTEVLRYFKACRSCRKTTQLIERGKYMNLDYLQFVEELMDWGMSEDEACREADYYFNPSEYNADDYDF